MHKLKLAITAAAILASVNAEADQLVAQLGVKDYKQAIVISTEDCMLSSEALMLRFRSTLNGLCFDDKVCLYTR